MTSSWNVTDGPLLSITGLGLEAGGPQAPARLVDGVDLTLRTGESLGIIGESGSGKSLTIRAIAGLLPRGVTRTAGEIRFAGRDLGALPEPEWQALRGAELGMIFQDSIGSLDPLFTTGQQITEAIRLHRPMSARKARAEAVALLDEVGIDRPDNRLRAYPHELSGGMARGWRSRSPSRTRLDCSSPTRRPQRSTSASRSRSSG
jgi:ABC-type microcin C transport system duplicated ATPase subunit YejF